MFTCKHYVPKKLIYLMNSVAARISLKEQNMKRLGLKFEIHVPPIEARKSNKATLSGGY